MGKIQISIIEKVKNELEITHDIDVFELSKLLQIARNNSHPDNYQEKSVKEEAEEKFKDLSQLYRDLATYISQERLAKKASEIAIYEERYELLDLQKKIIDLEKLIETLKLENRILNKSNEDLQEKLAKNQLQDLETSQHDLIEL